MKAKKPRRSESATVRPKKASYAKSDTTRERIIESAARIFAQRGYAHTRLEDIGKSANSHASGIYYYFSSREELVKEVLLRSTRRAIDAINSALSALPASATTEERIQAATIAQIRESQSRNFYTAAFNKIYPQVPESLRKRHRATLHEFFEIWRQIIHQGQIAGEVRTDIDQAVIRLTIAGAIQWSNEWADPEKSSPEVLGTQMAKLLCSGIAPPSR